MAEFFDNALESLYDFNNQLNSFKMQTPAEGVFESLKEYIINFERTLDNEHEIAFQMASFGQSITVYVDTISHSFNLISFEGYSGENRVLLVQHINQLSFLIVKVKKADPQKPTRKIGFAAE